MLRDLMTKIGQCERDLDRDVEASGERQLSDSSFSPCDYPPIEMNGTTTQRLIGTLDDDQLYLPCHYFTFAGGTSTGGYVISFPSRIVYSTDSIQGLSV